MRFYFFKDELAVDNANTVDNGYGVGARSFLSQGTASGGYDEHDGHVGSGWPKKGKLGSGEKWDCSWHEKPPWLDAIVQEHGEKQGKVLTGTTSS